MKRGHSDPLQPGHPGLSTKDASWGQPPALPGCFSGSSVLQLAVCFFETDVIEMRVLAIKRFKVRHLYYNQELHIRLLLSGGDTDNGSMTMDYIKIPSVWLGRQQGMTQSLPFCRLGLCT